MSLIRSRVLAVAAGATVVVGLGAGGAVAGSLTTGATIKNGTVRGVDLANGRVFGRDLHNNSVHKQDVGNNAVGRSELVEGSVGAYQLSDWVRNRLSDSGPQGARGPAGDDGSDGQDGVAGYDVFGPTVVLGSSDLATDNGDGTWTITLPVETGLVALSGGVRYDSGPGSVDTLASYPAVDPEPVQAPSDTDDGVWRASGWTVVVEAQSGTAVQPFVVFADVAQ